MELYADYRVAGFVTFSMGVVNHMRTASLYGEKRSGTSPPLGVSQQPCLRWDATVGTKPAPSRA